MVISFSPSIVLTPQERARPRLHRTSCWGTGMSPTSDPKGHTYGDHGAGWVSLKRLGCSCLFLELLALLNLLVPCIFHGLSQSVALVLLFPRRHARPCPHPEQVLNGREAEPLSFYPPSFPSSALGERTAGLKISWRVGGREEICPTSSVSSSLVLLKSFAYSCLPVPAVPWAP